MGGCIGQPTKKSKIIKNNNKGKHQINPQDQLDVTIDNNHPPAFTQPNKQQKAKPKLRKITGEEFTRTYKVEDNVGTSTRVEGPKYISNHSDGIGRVLRIVTFQSQGSIVQSNKQINIEERVRIFSELLNLDCFEDQEGNLLVLQDYYCGQYLEQVSKRQSRDQIRKFLSEVHQIIQSFHQKNIILGNLTVFSFRKTSKFDPTVRLVELNLSGHQEGMGHAFKWQKEIDWQAFGFIVQSVMYQFPPVFIQHKIQYVENSSGVLNALLKGKRIKRQEIDNLNFCKFNQNILLGYRLRDDIQKLLKLRKRRQHHRAIYYGEQVFLNGQKIADDQIHRIENARVLARIEGYIKNITTSSEQAFLMFGAYNESLGRLKAVFSISQQKKYEELRETLPLIK